MRLEALKSLLTVVQTRGGHMDVDGGLRGHLYLAPFAIAVIAAYIIICRDITELQI